MKEKLYTIPLNDAVNASDECPFCFIERELEQNSLDFVLGNSSSYMESDIRDQTDKAGFCRVHMKKMFDYGNTIAAWTAFKDCSCFICQNIEDTFKRYVETFFWLYRQDNEFKNKILRSKGFCLHHFGILCNGADKYLNDKEKAEFYPAMFRLMDENFQRMEEDLVWLSDKFDYRNKDADWKNSKDALQRGMQKLRSGYPADPVHKAK